MSLRRLQLDTSWGELQLTGGSRAGEGTLLMLPQLRLALDVGRPHRALPAMTTVLVSHGHVDHVGALAYWASQRSLNRLGAATVLAPSAVADDVAGLLELHARLEEVPPYPVTVTGLGAGDRHPLRKDMVLEAFATDHRVPTIGLTLWWTRSRLRPELAGRPPAEIAARRSAGETVTVEVATRLLSYGADSGVGLLAGPGAPFDAEVVILECSFFRPADRDRARLYGHLHLTDLVAAADRLRCRHLVLLHASRRHRLREVERLLAEELAPALDCRLHHLLVDWD